MLIYVCTSNTCRSPMAAELARLKGMGDVVSRSLSMDYEPVGSPANDIAQLVMREEYGADIGAHRSALLSQEDVDTCELIVGVSDRHRRIILERFPSSAGKVVCFSRDVPDPWRQPREVYLVCCQELDALISAQIQDWSARK